MFCARYSKRHFMLHPYILVLHIIPLAFVFPNYTKLVVIPTLSLALLLFLSTFWSTKSQRLQCYYKDSTGNFILFNDSLLPLTAESDSSNSSTLFSFIYNYKKYLLTSKGIIPINFRIDFTFNELFGGVVYTHRQFFPPNDLRVPNPSFFRLFKNQCVTPIFCFQIFSALLQFFDEHIMQGIFSLGMIFFVEAVLVGSRSMTLRLFRSLESKECLVDLVSQDEFNTCVSSKSSTNCKLPTNSHSTHLVSSVTLRPGDIIRIDEPTRLPCDLIILSGTCAVNEAMLSGESTPLMKEPITASQTIFDISIHKKHVLFGHTKIEQVSGSLYCRVIRTGFETEQGTLLRKMIASDDIRYDPEALRFVLLLSLLALINSLFTIIYSKKQGYALFIDIAILFTSSIPFDLPMEMSVIVHNVVKSMSAKGIYCLEPFRITLAGKVEVCCFDKTGTLTETKLEVKEIKKEREETEDVLRCCNGLITIKGEVRGDPLDLAIYEYLKNRDEHLGNRTRMKIVRNYQFTAELRRHSTVARFSGKKSYTLVAMKGAPETVRQFLKREPAGFESYKTYSAEGYRVIALACKTISQAGVEKGTREEYESQLEFAGFVLLGSSLKSGAVETCRKLAESGHRLVMITGDNLLTARCVGRQLGMGSRGVEGEEIEKLLGKPEFFETSIFARAEPRHKEAIIKQFNSAGMHTLMVGDGTNDVGALKAASVGVAMLDAAPDEPGLTTSPGLTANPSLMSPGTVLADNPIRPGDASVAAPFTVRSDSLLPIADIIQHGRSSLVTAIQMYKILALNSITSAFFLAFVDILGIKFSDPQMLALGLLSAVAFSATSASKPLPFISRQRPVMTIFSPYMLFSIIFQAAIHILSIFLICSFVQVPPLSDHFQPSLINSVLFVTSAVQTITTIFCNYIGRPFREDFHENKPMLLSLIAVVLFVFNCIFRFYSELNEMLQIVELDGLACLLTGLLLADTLLCLAVERFLFKIFMANLKDEKKDKLD